VVDLLGKAQRLQAGHHKVDGGWLRQ
jgi:hypothetical protein